MKNFGFSDLQATAILDMQLRRLAALERKNLDDEHKELKARIKYLEGLLRSEAKRLEVVVEETTALKEQFATPRRTVIVAATRSAAAGAGAVTTEADLVMPEGRRCWCCTPEGVQRVAAAGFCYRPAEGADQAGSARRAPGARAGRAGRRGDPAHATAGCGWRGAVGFVPSEGGADELGLERGDRSLSAWRVLRARRLPGAGYPRRKGQAHARGGPGALGAHVGHSHGAGRGR